MQSSKEEYARKRIHNGCSVRIENSVTRDNCSPASLLMPNSYPPDIMFNPHLTAIKDSYIPLDVLGRIWSWIVSDSDHCPLSTFEPHHEKTCLTPYANNKGADQPAHPCSLISTSAVRCPDSIIPILAKAKISRF